MNTKRSPIEWDQIRDKWRQSGLSQRAFCRNENINISSFNKCLNRKRLNGSTISNCTSDLKFLQINNVGNTTSNWDSAAIKKSLEVTLPNGITFKVGISQDEIHSFLLELVKWK